MKVEELYKKSDELPESAVRDAVLSIIDGTLSDEKVSFGLAGPRKMVMRAPDAPRDLKVGDYSYKQVAMLGTEKLTYLGCYVGRRDGILLCFGCNEVLGREGEDLFIEINLKAASTNITLKEDRGEGNEPLVHTLHMALAERFITVDPTRVVEEEKERVEREKAEQTRKRALEIKETYGNEWGTWG